MWKWGCLFWLGTGACWDASPQKSNMKQPHLSVWSSAWSAAGIKHSPNSINIKNRLSPTCPTAQQTPDKICNQAENMANGDPGRCLCRCPVILIKGATHFSSVPTSRLLHVNQNVAGSQNKWEFVLDEFFFFFIDESPSEHVGVSFWWARIASQRTFTYERLSKLHIGGSFQNV